MSFSWLRRSLNKLVESVAGTGAAAPRPTSCTLGVEQLEDRVVPTIAVGADAGGGPEVRTFTDRLRQSILAFYPYDPAFTGGVRVALGDVTGDGVQDLITAPGAGGGPHVIVFNGVNGLPIRQFFAYDAGFTGGVYVAAGDINGDGRAEIVTGAGAGGGPHVKVFDGLTGALSDQWYAYDANFTGGVTVAVGDVNADGFGDVVTGAGPGGGPHVKVFSGVLHLLLDQFYAYDSAFTGGVFVSTGNMDFLAGADVITGPGAGGGPEVKAIGLTFAGGIVSRTLIQDFYAFDPNFTGGVRVAAFNPDGFGVDDFVLGAGPGGIPQLRLLQNNAAHTNIQTFSPFPVDFPGGIFVS